MGRRTYFVMLLVFCILSLFVILSISPVYTSSRVEFNSDEISYIRDSRTNLCYAYIAVSDFGLLKAKGIALTRVPCSEKVLSLLNKKENNSFFMKIEN